MPGARVERACPAFQTGALTATASLANLVEEEGIEPSFAGCRPAVLPLNDSPKNWLRAGELNATRMAYEASMTPVHLPAENWSGKLGSNQRPLDYRSSAQTTLSFSRLTGAPCQIRTGFSGLQVRRIADYAYRACDSGANGANRTLIGCLPCNCSPIELHRLEPEGVFETPTSALRMRCSST